MKNAICTLLLTAVSLTAVNALAADDKILVVYFSHSGNTMVLAGLIQAETGADLLEIKAVKPYPTNYDEATRLARQELADKVRPEILPVTLDMAAYDTIFVGYPIWWGTMPMPMFTFMEQYDFSGKTVAPFATHGGSRLGTSVDDIKRLAPNANVTQGLAVNGRSAANAQNDVQNWLKALGLAK